jgi:uncharacterized protein (TIGR02145 family)
MNKTFLFILAFFFANILMSFGQAAPASPPAGYTTTQSNDKVGIGTMLKIDSTQGYKTTVIKSLVAGAPAEAAGLKAGDVILKVNGQSTLDVALKNVVDMIVGKEGTEVKLNIARNGTNYDYTILRGYKIDATSKIDANGNLSDPFKSESQPAATKSSYELEFEEFLNSYDSKKEEPVKEEPKTPSEFDMSSSASFLLDFENYDWTNKVPNNGKTLTTVTIGNQVWMGQNLDVTTFRNGDAIPEVRTDAEWEKAYDDKKPAWCYYNNDAANGTKYGKLYNWWAVADSRGLAPAGWRVPTKDDWNRFTTYLGSGAAKKLKATSGWNENGNGTSEGSFAAVPAGFRETAPDSFGKAGSNAYFWSSSIVTMFQFEFGAGLNLKYNSDEPEHDGYAAEGLSVRCIKD